MHLEGNFRKESSMCTLCKTLFGFASWNLCNMMLCKADVQGSIWNHISLVWNWKSNVAVSNRSKRIVTSYAEYAGKLVFKRWGEKGTEMCPQGNFIYLFLILTEGCVFLHTHLSLEYVIFSLTSSHGNNNWNIGSFFPTKYYLFCLNCLYFNSIANRLFSHLLCGFCAFLQNEKLWMNGCPCIFFVLFPFQETGARQ